MHEAIYLYRLRQVDRQRVRFHTPGESWELRSSLYPHAQRACPGSVGAGRIGIQQHFVARSDGLKEEECLDRDCLSRFQCRGQTGKLALLSEVEELARLSIDGLRVTALDRPECADLQGDTEEGLRRKCVSLGVHGDPCMILATSSERSSDGRRCCASCLATAPMRLGGGRVCANLG